MIIFRASWQQSEEFFEKTPPLATHQVAFVVSEFDATANGEMTNDNNIYAFTHSDYSEKINYIIGETPGLLSAMQNFTELNYMLPKLDLFAVPDFKSEAMGNWGITTYRYA